MYKFAKSTHLITFLMKMYIFLDFLGEAQNLDNHKNMTFNS